MFLSLTNTRNQSSVLLKLLGFKIKFYSIKPKPKLRKFTKTKIYFFKYFFICYKDSSILDLMHIIQIIRIFFSGHDPLAWGGSMVYNNAHVKVWYQRGPQHTQIWTQKHCILFLPWAKLGWWCLLFPNLLFFFFSFE